MECLSGSIHTPILAGFDKRDEAISKYEIEMTYEMLTTTTPWVESVASLINDYFERQKNGLTQLGRPKDIGMESVGLKGVRE